MGRGGGTGRAEREVEITTVHGVFTCDVCGEIQRIGDVPSSFCSSGTRFWRSWPRANYEMMLRVPQIDPYKGLVMVIRYRPRATVTRFQFHSM